LWGQCPLEWLEATRYDGSYYDPVFRDGVPDGCRERWRLIREFTERWHGIDVPDAGGRPEEVRQAERRLGVELPPSLREYVAYVYDLAGCGAPYDPRQYSTMFHSAYYLLHHLHRHSAVSLIYCTLDSGVLGVAHEDLGDADPRTHFFDEALDESGGYIPPAAPRPHRGPTVFASSLSLSIFQNLFIELPTAGDMEAGGVNPGDWLPRLAEDFPIHARFDGAHVFESNELLVLVSGPRGSYPEHFVEAIVRRPIPVESVPASLLGRTGRNTVTSGMLTPEPYRRQREAELRRPGVRQPACWDRAPDPAHFDLRTYVEWVRYAGRYPLWLSALRRRGIERLVETQGRPLGERQPPPQDAPRFDGDDAIPF
jgi:hypothetical protein